MPPLVGNQDHWFLTLVLLVLSTAHCTVLVLRMAHRIWKETKQEPGPAGPDNMLGC